MKKSLSILLLFFFVKILTAQQIEKYHRVRVDLEGKNIEKLAALGIETDHGDFVAGRSFTTDLSDFELKLVQNAGFQTKIEIEDVSNWYEKQLQKPQPAADRNADCAAAGFDFYGIPTPVNYKNGSMGGYLTYQQLMDELDEMRAKFPNLISMRKPINDTILTHENRPIFFVKISDNPNFEEAEPEILYDALHHAREPNSMSALVFWMWHLLENYGQNPEIQYIVNNAELYFIPCVNPDGYLYNESIKPNGGGMFRKNRRKNADGTFGVDLNRNYGYKWGFDDAGSSPEMGTQTYRGPAPFSEPETRMMRDFARTHDFKIIFNNHTYSNLLIYPWAYADSLAHPFFPKLGTLLSRENKFKTGLGSETVGYPVNGDADDWFFAEGGSFALTPEIGPAAYGFWPPESEIDFLNKTAFLMNKKAALCLLRFGEVFDESQKYFKEKNIEIPFSLVRYGFWDGDLTVRLNPISINIQNVSAPQTFDIQQFERATNQFSFQLKNTVAVGDEFKFELVLENGDLVWRDTFTKIFGYSTAAVFNDDAENLDNWTTDNWNLTASDFVSPPFSFTDSDGGDYFSNNQNSLISVAPILIPAGVVSPRLNFFAKWSIETNYDFVQVLVFENQDFRTPICGKYTVPGEQGQPFDEPVFEGSKNNWVAESMDLSDFVGKEIFIEFRMVSDGFQEFDGFYFDDLAVEFSTPTGTKTLPIGQFSLSQNQPNPTSGQTLVFWENPANISGDANLLIFNQLGIEIENLPIQLNGFSKILVDTKNWVAGQYFYQIRTAAGNSTVRKMSVVK